MEPITTFFIFEGITFGIIGSILIVQGLFFRNDPEYVTKVKKIIEELKNNEEVGKSVSKNIEDFNNFEHKSKLEETISLLLTDVDNLGIRHNQILKSVGSFFKYILDTNEISEHKSQQNALRGLPFLLGGFLLQGIGVITQL